jgi:NADH-quinone oxidoreductase subunit C
MTDTGTTTEEASASTPVDEKRQPMLDLLQSELGDALVGSEIAKDDITVRVDRSVWKRTAELCRDRLAMDYFCFLNGIDWLPADLSGEKAFEPAGGLEEIATAEDGAKPLPTTIETGVAGGETRFQVFARYYSVTSHLGITVKADLDEADPHVESIVSVYRGADWHERETWEMLGFQFDGHPGLRHLYLPGGFEGYPLRKDFPLLAREVKPWPGLVDVEPLPGEEPGAEGEEEGES